mgnify:CR=1 FL=1
MVDIYLFEKWMGQLLERFDNQDRMLALLLRHTGAENPASLDDIKKIKLWNGERLFDNQDLCIMLQVSKRSLQRYRSLGLLPYLMLRQKTYYKESDVVQFLIRHLKDFKKEDIEVYKARLK